MPAKFVIHTVGPVWQGGNCGESEQLESCYRSAMRTAMAEHFESIAFPAISCGVYGYPVKEATAIAVTTICDVLTKVQRRIDVTLVAFDANMLAAFEDALEAHF